MSMSLRWVRCFLWTAILHSSFRLYSPICMDSCGCLDQEKKHFYNLEPLTSKDGENASFRVNSRDPNGHSYSFDPCTAFKLGPEGNGNECRGRNVAICQWVPNLKELPGTYKIRGDLRKATCDLDPETKTPIVVYKVNRSNVFRNFKSTVRLKCDEGKKHNATFELLDEKDDLTFQLSYLWDGCPLEQSTLEPTITHAPINVGGPVAAAVGGVAMVIVLFFIGRYVKNRNDNNDDDEPPDNDERDNNDEEQPLLGNGGGDQHPNIIHNPFEEWNSEYPIRPRPIGSSYTRADNVIRILRA